MQWYYTGDIVVMWWWGIRCDPTPSLSLSRSLVQLLGYPRLASRVHRGLRSVSFLHSPLCAPPPPPARARAALRPPSPPPCHCCSHRTFRHIRPAGRPPADCPVRVIEWCCYGNRCPSLSVRLFTCPSLSLSLVHRPVRTGSSCRQAKWVRPVPCHDVLMFGTAMSVIMYHLKRHCDDVKPY